MKRVTKTKSRPGLRKLEINISSYCNSYYIKRIAQLEKLLARKPRVVQLDFIGIGEISADLALLCRSILLQRSPKTKLVTNARSSLQNGTVLIWLLGDRRIIRDDARVFFRRTALDDLEDAEVYAGLSHQEPKYKDSDSTLDPEEGDHACVLKFINEYLPVNEFAGRLVGVPLLREFGLVENERVDNFLATVFQKTATPLTLVKRSELKD